MESITVYPKNEKQKSLLTSLLEEMKIRFETPQSKDKTLLSEDEFYAKIDRAIKQAEDGKVTKVRSKKELQSFLESI